MRVRRGGAADAPAILAMLDGAVAWMAARGNTGQWGASPWTADPARVRRIVDQTRRDEVWIAELDGRTAGAMTTGTGPAHAEIPAAGEPEVYVTLLVTDRAAAGRGVGSALLELSVDLARRRGLGLVRVDCYAGNGGRLVDYYRRNGFAPVAPFTVDGWPGQLLARRPA
ncbi:GNAT family N-acetyltransferase [Actinomadura sp. PM05-2]|uniref:GNAT family N-acetyltransferase n=1 Tax=Actinomadura parmotrematis TaxID=2864039 RepID=A0ABS7FVK6_9ACTN|nr:GNAT family N-acetyltransferase [Actinomadura parmotrematis]